MNQDDEHLKVLSIFHYVVAGVTALFALIPVIYMIIGLVFLLAPGGFGGQAQPLPAFIGMMFITLAGFFIACGWIFAALIFLAGHFLARRKHHTFCLVIAGLECLCMPFGTALGIFSIMILTRSSVKQLFADIPAPPAA